MSVLAWMVHGAWIGALLAVGAAACAWGLRARGWPTRGVWAGAAAGTVLLPALLRLSSPPLGPPGGGTLPGGLPASVLADAPADAGGGAAGLLLPALPASVEAALGVAWLLGSGVMLVLLAVSLVRLARRRRRWAPARVLGAEVRLSRDTGPAAVGLLDPEIVLPRDALEMDPGELQLVLAHEREHARARDPGLLALGALALAVAPWNPALWWISRRLRGAVEMDCDRRVLARGVSPRTYGRLLIAVSVERSRPLPAVAAMGERRSHLERRILAMTESRPRHPTLKLAGGLVIALAVVAVACETPAPTTSASDAASTRTADAEQPASTAGEFRITGDDTVSVRLAAGPGSANRDGDGDARVRLAPDGRTVPIVFLDGERVERGDVGELEPSRISSIEVLKGPAATERYGPEAGGGVILIRTKATGEGNAG